MASQECISIYKCCREISKSFRNYHSCGCMGCLFCVIIALCLLLITGFIKSGAMDCMWEALIIVIKQVWITNDPSIALANWFSFIVTAIACIFAWCAYIQSKRARKSAAFSMLFAQLIGSHRDIFGNKALELAVNEQVENETGIKDKQGDVFSVFFQKYKVEWENTPKSPSSFIMDFWHEFVDNLSEEPRFSNCFKYVYHEIKTVLKEPSLGKTERKLYIGIIQANMNYNELFCYFINLLQHYSANKKETLSNEDEDFLEGLKFNQFFENIVEVQDKDYYRLIKNLRNKAANGTKPDIRIQEIIDKIVVIKNSQND